MNDEERAEIEQRRRDEGRCVRCGNWPKICGHDLPFKERIQGVKPTYNGWGPTR